jgi:hypothetical protein
MSEKNKNEANIMIDASSTKKKESKVSKKNIEKKQVKKNKKYKIMEKIKRNKKKYIFALLTLIIMILVLVCAIFLNRYFINKKYDKYEEKMDIYGFDLLYNNESAESYEKVTNLEAVKIALGSIYNTYDVSSIGYFSSEEYEGADWIKTAEIFGVLEKNKINKENTDEYISYWDFIELFLNTRKLKLNIEVSYTKESSFENLNSYNQKQTKYINDLVENKLIEDSTKKISLNKDVIKGQVNEIVIKYVEKYNSILEEGETLVTKKESMPQNSDEFPYIIYSIPNDVYEMDMINDGNTGYVSPKNLYKLKKEYYNQMDYRITNYYDKILNINYETINVEEFANNVEEYLLYNYDDEVFSKYVNYVKENNVILEGKAEPLIPIIYYDGVNMRIRTKITFKIINSLTDKNIIFGDVFENESNPITYKNKEYTIYAEVPMSRLLNVVSYRTEIKSIANILSDKSLINNNTI